MADEELPTTAAALQEWRAAEQVAAVANRGKVATDAAIKAAAQAEEAATATADAAKAAMQAATLAAESATKTADAGAARRVAR